MTEFNKDFYFIIIDKVRLGRPFVLFLIEDLQKLGEICLVLEALVRPGAYIVPILYSKEDILLSIDNKSLNILDISDFNNQYTRIKHQLPNYDFFGMKALKGDIDFNAYVLSAFGLVSSYRDEIQGLFLSDSIVKNFPALQGKINSLIQSKEQIKQKDIEAEKRRCSNA